MIADPFDAILLDLDGVLFRGDRAIDGAGDTVARLRSMGKGLAFVTNNAARTPEQVVEHLASLEIHATVEEVETSALTAAAALARRGVRSAFVIGEEGLRSALVAVGIRPVTTDTDTPVDAVVVGWARDLTYAMLRRASTHLQRGARFVGCNPDTSYPAPDGLRWPGAGATLAALEATTGHAPEVMGKPFAPILEAGLERAGGGRPLVVGDRLDTDIEGASRLGWSSMLVLSGVTSTEELGAVSVRPTFIADDLRALVATGARAMLRGVDAPEGTDVEAG